MQPIAAPSPSSSPSPVASPTCGDPPDSAALAWYPVFLDGADLEEVRNKHCKDAIAVKRSETGNPSIQVASFSSYDRAERFANKVQGVVGSPKTPEGTFGIGKNDIEKTFDEAGIELKFKLSTGYGNVMFAASLPEDEVDAGITVWGSENISQVSLLFLVNAATYDRVREVDKFYISTLCKSLDPTWSDGGTKIAEVIEEILLDSSEYGIPKTLTYGGKTVTSTVLPPTVAADGRFLRGISIGITP